MSTTNQVKIGVFIPGDAQLLDTACIDVFAMMSLEYLSLLEFLPKHIVALAPSVKIYYITSKANANAMIPLTASMSIAATHDLSHADVQPGKLDILLVPGPDPRSSWDEDVLSYLRAHGKSQMTDVLSVCTGIFLCGAAGLLDGRTACGPRGLQDQLKKLYPTSNLVGDKYRWYQDGNFWSSGGVTNGNDLVAAYARSSKHFPGPLVEISCKLADVGDRSHSYEQGQMRFTVGFVWQLVRALFASPTKSTKSA